MIGCKAHDSLAGIINYNKEYNFISKVQLIFLVDLHFFSFFNEMMMISFLF